MCLIYKNINYKWSVVEVKVVVENRDDCFIQRPPGRRHFLFTIGEENIVDSMVGRAGLLWKIIAKF